MLVTDRHAAQADWAQSQGLEPRDGEYLHELSFRPLTIPQLCEALAIHSQSREMVELTLERLMTMGFVTVAQATVFTGLSPRRGP